jgi:hypothetical protein
VGGRCVGTPIAAVKFPSEPPPGGNRPAEMGAEDEVRLERRTRFLPVSRSSEEGQKLGLKLSLMCGRYLRRADKQRIVEAFRLGKLPEDFTCPC